MCHFLVFKLIIGVSKLRITSILESGAKAQCMTTTKVEMLSHLKTPWFTMQCWYPRYLGWIPQDLGHGYTTLVILESQARSVVWCAPVWWGPGTNIWAAPRPLHTTDAAIMGRWEIIDPPHSPRHRLQFQNSINRSWNLFSIFYFPLNTLGWVENSCASLLFYQILPIEYFPFSV